MDEFIRCFFIGFALASVIGPISILCINQTIKYGFSSGFSCCLGASTADAFYSAIAAFGVSFVINFLNDYQYIFKLFGGLVLAGIGLKLLLTNIAKDEKIKTKKQNFILNYIAVLLLTIANPLTIILYMSAFTSIPSGPNPIIMVLGILIGSIFAYLFLLGFVLIIKRKSDQKVIFMISKISAFVIFLFGSYNIINFQS